jgi:hypothetical protein
VIGCVKGAPWIGPPRLQLQGVAHAGHLF